MSIDKWMFGDQPDELANKVLKNMKTATCALYKGEIPELNEKNIIMNSKEQDVCMIEIYDYKIIKFSEMTDEMAKSEGENDLQEWIKIHRKFFSSELKISEKSFDEETLVIYYSFRVIEKYV